MSEYSDAIARAKRLSVAHEALVMGKPLVTESLVTLEDMQIYTRWLVSHYRSVKHIHSFLKVSYTTSIQLIFCKKSYCSPYHSVEGCTLQRKP